jgi:hypothetical protein
MFPSQINELARLHASELSERPKAVRQARRQHAETGTIRRRTGWTLVQIGLRIAASASR